MAMKDNQSLDGSLMQGLASQKSVLSFAVYDIINYDIKEICRDECAHLVNPKP